MTNILTGTVDISAGTPPVVKWNGVPLYAANCPQDSALTIDGRVYYVDHLADTSHPVFTRAFAGTVPSTGLVAEISPYTADTVSTATANIRLAKLLAALNLSPAGVPLQMDGTSTTVGDPGTGRVRFNSATSPTVLCISKTDLLGHDLSVALGLLDDVINALARSNLQLVPNDGSSTLIVFRVTGAVTDAGAYVQVPVSVTAGAVPADQAQLAMSFSISGADGTPGASPSAFTFAAFGMGI